MKKERGNEVEIGDLSHPLRALENLQSLAKQIQILIMQN